MSRIKDEKDHFHDTLPKRIRETMDKQRLSYKELEEKSGINAKQLSRYGLGDTEPTANILAKLAKALNVSVDYLLGLSDVSLVGGSYMKLNTVGDVVTILDALYHSLEDSEMDCIEGYGKNERTYVNLTISDKNVVKYYVNYFRIIDKTYDPYARPEEEKMYMALRLSELKKLNNEMFDFEVEPHIGRKDE